MCRRFSSHTFSILICFAESLEILTLITPLLGIFIICSFVNPSLRLRAYKHCWLFSQSHAEIYDPWRFSREDRFYRACWLVLAAKKLGRWYFRLLYKQTWPKCFLNARLRFVSKTTWNRFREQKEDSLVCWYTSRELFYDSLRTFSQVNLVQIVYYYAMNLYLHSHFSFLLCIYFLRKYIFVLFPY